MEYSDEDDEEYRPVIKEIQSDFITLTLPRKGILKGTSELSARLNTSLRQQTAMAAQVVKLGGGSLKKCTMSISSAYRHKKSAIEEAADNIKKTFKATMPDFLIIHWDGKVVEYKRKQFEDRLAIVASDPTDHADKEHFQFLGAPCMENGKGQTMCDTLLEMLDQWQIEFKTILGTSWDTTASNSGKFQGAAFLLERVIGEQRLALACRHHIGERHITHANTEVRGESSGGSISIHVCECFILVAILKYT